MLVHETLTQTSIINVMLVHETLTQKLSTGK